MAGSIQHASLVAPGYVQILTTPCVVCRKPSELVVDEEAYKNWQAGTHIQFAFPDMSIEDREVLISGTHSDCFDKLFPKAEGN